MTGSGPIATALRAPSRVWWSGGDHVHAPLGLTVAGVTVSDTDPKYVVRRLIDEVMNERDLSVLDELYTPRLAPAARRWIEPFLASFSEVDMRIVELVAEGETVVGRFACSGTHTGAWLGHAATGRRFLDIAEVYFFRVVDGRIARAWGLGPGRHRRSNAPARPGAHLREALSSGPAADPRERSQRRSAVPLDPSRAPVRS